MNTFSEERDMVFIDAVVNDNWSGVEKHAKKYDIPVPKDEKIMKAGIYKAVQYCIKIPEEVKILAMQKCIKIGFYPFIRAYEAERETNV